MSQRDVLSEFDGHLDDNQDGRIGVVLMVKPATGKRS